MNTNASGKSGAAASLTALAAMEIGSADLPKIAVDNGQFIFSRRDFRLAVRAHLSEQTLGHDADE